MDTATHEDVWTTMERQLREQVPLDWRTPRDPVVLAIYSEKGGIGKSALAAGVTAVMAQNGKSVLAIDLDPRATFTHELNALKGDRSVNDLLYVDPDGDPEEEPPLAGMAAAALRPAGEEWGKNVVVLAAERALANRETDNTSMVEQRLRVALEGVSNQVDITVIDVPPRAGGKLVQAGLVAATHIIYPGTLTPDGHVGITDAIKSKRRVQQTSSRGLIEVGTLRNIVDGQRTQIAGMFNDKFHEDFPNLLPFVVPARVVRVESRYARVPITASKSSGARDLINGYTHVLNAVSRAKAA